MTTTPVFYSGAGVQHAPGKPVQLGHHPGVTLADRCQGLVGARPAALGAGQPEVNTVLGEPRFTKTVVFGRSHLVAQWTSRRGRFRPQPCPKPYNG